MSIARWIGRWASTERVAFWFEGQEVTYSALDDRIAVVAAELMGHGIAAGDRVGFCGLNRLELFETLFAAARIGAIFVPYNNRLTAHELAAQITDSDPALLVATDGFDSLLTDAAPSRTIRDLDREPFTDSSARVDRDISSHETADDPVLMVYTSGTTGIAKGALLSNSAILHTVLNGIDQQKLTGDDCIIAPLPTFHVGGLNIQTLPTLYVGGKVLMQRGFDPADVLKLIRDHRPTQTLLVPAMLAAVAAQPDFDSTDLSCLRGINSGSSVVPLDVMRPFFDRGVPIGQVYGATETGPTAVVLAYEEGEANIGTCGRPALHTELRIVDEAGADVPLGSSGELWLRGPNNFSGYWQNQQATLDAFADGDWFRTGDVGHVNQNGCVVISDRIKDVVISGGENIYPAELEPVLVEHPEIAEVAVIGQHDDRWGEVPVAVVVLVSGSSLDVDELRAWADSRLARFKLPRHLRVVGRLPRTALGKVKKHELREL